MDRPDDPGSDRPPFGVSRRGFLRTGTAAGLGLASSREALASPRRATPPTDPGVDAILLFLVGGPSQIDTWDPKPDAPEDVRGAFRPIETEVPGVWVSELFPRLARQMSRVSMVRTLHHDAPPVHDTGHQLFQTGRLSTDGTEYPHFGAVVSSFSKGPRGGLPANVLLPGPIGATGGNMSHGQGAGILGAAHDPFRPGDATTPETREALRIERESPSTVARYGPTEFGRNCLRARRLVERGSRFVTVNMYQTVFHRPTWDAHGAAPFSPIDAYRDAVAPTFDLAYAALIDDLASRGMLDTTMVLAVGEFGRTPKINASGGRDHHPGCWTALFAGGPFAGGRVVGASDRHAHTPRDRPVSAPEFAATVYEGLGFSPDAEITAAGSPPIRLVAEGAEPVRELFRA